MLHQFAVDPDLVRRARNTLVFNDIVDQRFGWGTPRLVVPLPDLNSWKTSILNGDHRYSETDEKRIEECYLTLKENHIPRNASEIWDSSRDWLMNAEVASEKYDFHAILSTRNPRNHPRVLVHPDHTRNPQWKLLGTRTIHRTVEDVFEVCIRDMAQFAKKFYFIDPYFDPTEDRYRSSFREYFRRIRDQSIYEGLQIEIKCQPRTSNWEKRSKSEWKTQLSNILPTRISLRVVFVDRSIRLHNRYILCEHGGLGFCNGFDCQCEDQEDNVYVLSKEDYMRVKQRLWSPRRPEFISVP